MTSFCGTKVTINFKNWITCYFFCCCCIVYVFQKLFSGTTCPDPGYPRGGYLSGDVKGFQLDQVATFGCNRAGFNIPSGSALKCMLSGTANSLIWNSTVPTECEGKYSYIIQWHTSLCSSKINIICELGNNYFLLMLI